MSYRVISKAHQIIHPWICVHSSPTPISPSPSLPPLPPPSRRVWVRGCLTSSWDVDLTLQEMTSRKYICNDFRFFHLGKHVLIHTRTHTHTNLCYLSCKLYIIQYTRTHTHSQTNKYIYKCVYKHVYTHSQIHIYMYINKQTDS